MRSGLGVHWKDWCWSWNCNNLATWCEQLTQWKRPWCWERLRAGGEGDDRGWDGRMASPTRWTWVWVDSRSWWWTERPAVLRCMGSQRVGTRLSDWIELNIMEKILKYMCVCAVYHKLKQDCKLTILQFFKNNKLYLNKIGGKKRRFLTSDTSL